MQRTEFGVWTTFAFLLALTGCAPKDVPTTKTGATSKDKLSMHDSVNEQKMAASATKGFASPEAVYAHAVKSQLAKDFESLASCFDSSTRRTANTLFVLEITEQLAKLSNGGSDNPQVAGILDRMRSELSALGINKEVLDNLGIKSLNHVTPDSLRAASEKLHQSIGSDKAAFQKLLKVIDETRFPTRNFMQYSGEVTDVEITEDRAKGKINRSGGQPSQVNFLKNTEGWFIHINMT